MSISSSLGFERAEEGTDQEPRAIHERVG